MTSAVASADRENSDLADVHGANLHEPSADMTSAVASAEQGKHSDPSEMFASAKHSMKIICYDGTAW
jgi:hypothetical protein